jgi:hypothetical protein
MNFYAILAAVAVFILAIAEILISIQKAQMKKQFLEELNRQDDGKIDKIGDPSSDTPDEK